MSKYNKINIVFCIFLIICIIFMVVTPIFIFPQVGQVYEFERAKSEGVFLELWEIDTFEGGTSSRAKFLENVAVNYESKHNGVYIIVRNLSLEQARTMLSLDKTPDMISFGIGAGEMISSYAHPMGNGFDVRGNVLNSAKVDGDILALPWCMGGYIKCLKDNMDDIIGVGVENTVPPIIDGMQYKKYNTQYEAYKGFVNNDVNMLLGTQRDYFRISNKLALGAMQGCNFEYISSYTDLVQYIANTSVTKNCEVFVDSFLGYLLSSTVQQKLKNIGMFSVTDEVGYSDSDCAQFEECVRRVDKIQNVFISDVEIKEKQSKL